MASHVIRPKTYLIVYAALLALLVLTVGVSAFPLGDFNLLAALLIAAAKTALIAVFFMHLRYGSGVTRVFSVAGLLWLALLIGLTLSDVLTRHWDRSQWTSPAALVDVSSGPAHQRD